MKDVTRSTKPWGVLFFFICSPGGRTHLEFSTPPCGLGIYRGLLQRPLLVKGFFRCFKGPMSSQRDAEWLLHRLATLNFSKTGLLHIAKALFPSHLRGEKKGRVFTSSASPEIWVRGTSGVTHDMLGPPPPRSPPDVCSQRRQRTTKLEHALKCMHSTTVQQGFFIFPLSDLPGQVLSCSYLSLRPTFCLYYQEPRVMLLSVLSTQLHLAPVGLNATFALLLDSVNLSPMYRLLPARVWYIACPFHICVLSGSWNLAQTSKFTTTKKKKKREGC